MFDIGSLEWEECLAEGNRRYGAGSTKAMSYATLTGTYPEATEEQIVRAVEIHAGFIDDDTAPDQVFIESKKIALQLQHIFSEKDTP